MRAARNGTPPYSINVACASTSCASVKAGPVAVVVAVKVCGHD
jgi:hypothetical protein